MRILIWKPGFFSMVLLYYYYYYYCLQSLSILLRVDLRKRGRDENTARPRCFIYAQIHLRVERPAKRRTDYFLSSLSCVSRATNKRHKLSASKPKRHPPLPPPPPSPLNPTRYYDTLHYKSIIYKYNKYNEVFNFIPGVPKEERSRGILFFSASFVF